ncbi:hypothetical protein DsansV1_C08g0081661 [Dioscorea sansibarensis]
MQRILDKLCTSYHDPLYTWSNLFQRCHPCFLLIILFDASGCWRCWFS